MSDVPSVLSFLPLDYEYKVVNFEPKDGNNFTVFFKIKNVKTEEQAMKWLKDYEETTKYTWRTLRTFKSCGKYNIFRKDYRCQHKTESRNRQKEMRLSKNTDCPASLKIIIRRYFDIPNFKEPEEETKNFPCFIQLYSCHNHFSDTASFLRFRDVSAATKEKLISLFEAGHTAASARHALKDELLQQNPEEYHILSADSSLLPSLSVIQHLLNRTCPKPCGVKRRVIRKKDSSAQVYKKVKTNRELLAFQHSTDDDNYHLFDYSELKNDILETKKEDSCSSTSLKEESDEFFDELNEEKEIIKSKFEDWCNRVRHGLEYDSEIFLPAVTEMLINYDTHAMEESNFISALHNFAKFEKPRTQFIKHSKKLKEIKILVHPRSTGETETIYFE